MTWRGLPVRGAHVEVHCTRPADSLGEALLAVVPGRRLKPTAKSTTTEPIALRHRWLAALEAADGRRIPAHDTLTLAETAPGCYEAQFKATEHAGTYAFRWHADGIVPGDHDFVRDGIAAVHLDERPDPAKSTLTWLRGQPWRARFQPRTARSMLDSVSSITVRSCT